MWCDLRGMKLNASKINTMIVFRSRAVHPQLTALTLSGTELNELANLVILTVRFDAKVTFEKHHRSVSSAAAQRLGSMRKSWQVFHDWSLLLRSFWSTVPVLKYCSQCGARLLIYILNYWIELLYNPVIVIESDYFVLWIEIHITVQFMLKGSNSSLP